MSAVTCAWDFQPSFPDGLPYRFDTCLATLKIVWPNSLQLIFYRFYFSGQIG